MSIPRPTAADEVVLALETSCRAASVALGHGGETRSKTLDPTCSHASDLLPALDSLLAAAGLQPGELTRIIVGTGPGSYTGLRVGSALGQGLARGSGAQLLGIPSGEGLAFSRLEPGTEGVHLLDARAGQVTFTRFSRTEHDVLVSARPAVLDPAELTAEMLEGAVLFADAAALTAADLGQRFIDGGSDDTPPHARHLLALDHSRRQAGIAPAETSVMPLYLRPYAARIKER